MQYYNYTLTNLFSTRQIKAPINLLALLCLASLYVGPIPLVLNSIDLEDVYNYAYQLIICIIYIEAI